MKRLRFTQRRADKWRWAAGYFKSRSNLHQKGGKTLIELESSCDDV
jgi:hypothetical protein